MTELEGWLLTKLREVEPEAEQQDLYTGKICIGGAWAMELIEEWHNKQQKPVENINYDTVLADSVCKSYGSCYRPEKMQHEKECRKHCPYYKQTDS